LVDLHGQHENQSLLRPATRLEMLDRFGEADQLRAACRKAHQEARSAAQQLAELHRAARDKADRQSLYRFQLQELEAARLDELDPQTLDSDLKLLRSAEAIRAAAARAAQQLDGDDGESAAGLMARAERELRGLSDPGAETARLAERLDGLLAETRDLSAGLAALAEKAQSDPARLAELEELRANWRALERKHGRDLAGLRALRDELRARLADLGRLELRSEQCQAQLDQAVSALRAAAGRLTRQRQSAARELQRRVGAELAELGLKGATLKLALVPHPADTAAAPSAKAPAEADEAARLLPADLGPAGAEELELLFSANPELPLKPLAECASGGELSRVMLALKGVLAQARGADRLPVVVFDEVDSGVGGRTGAVLGRKLAALAGVRQVLVVTHLPQLAAYAHLHLKVEKLRRPGAAAICAAPVEGQARVEELALMLRGEAASERTRQEAAEMLRSAQADAEQRRPSKPA
jgi:DNA repair protein RecN (Recombination protein N)